MAFRSIETNSTTATDLVVTKPAGVVSGDILVAFGVSDGEVGTYTWPTGFTEVTGSPVSTTADAQLLGVAIKVAGGSEPANYTITVSSNTIIGGIAAFSGAVSTQPHRVSATTNNSANASPWTMTSAAFSSSTAVICDLVVIAGSDTLTSVDVVHSGPPGYNLQADIRSGFRNGMLSTKNSVATEETGVLSATGTLGGATAGWGIIAVALELTSGSSSLTPVVGGQIFTGVSPTMGLTLPTRSAIRGT